MALEIRTDTPSLGATGRPVPQVDVVILTWNDGPLLSAALASALGSRDVDVRVFVVDNGSDPPAEIGRDPHVRLVRNATNRGVAPARNQGVRLGTSPLVCLLDSDARLAPRSLRAMADHLLASPDLGLVAPVFVDQPPEASAGRRPTLARKLARGAGLTARYRGVRRDPRATTWDVHFAIGACQLMRRVAFDAVGGLDDAIFYGPEDVDFCLRLRRAGWRVVQAADAPCFHPPRRRNRTLVSRSGIAHGLAVLRHLHRHRKVGA